MRITNKIMQRNNLSNINTNKIYQDTLSTQMSTQKKINRPSDDPVVAIRALRLRSSVTEITQYYSKNIPDAESWLSVTEDSLKNLTSIVTNMISQVTKGSNGDLTSSDRQIILEQLKALRDEVYATGDADYAGRYVFTGYRTDTSLSFPTEEEKLYTITEQVDNSAISKLTKIDTGNLLDINATNYDTIDLDTVDEQAVSSIDVYRIRLAYDNCYDNTGATGGVIPSITYYSDTKDANGDYTKQTIQAETMNSYKDPYTEIAKDENKNKVIYVPETGEMLLGSEVYNTLMQRRDDPATTGNEAEIQVTYEKKEWAIGDLRPEHYFYCQSEGIEYNASFLTGNAERQDIEYDVGFNQTIRVNSTADQCFQHGIGREVDDLLESMQNVLDLEAVVAKIEDIMASETDTDKLDKLQTQLDAANKALTLAKDKNQKLFEQGITTLQGHLDNANLCITECGTRGSKLTLIKNRMQSQKTTFETLKSENEDVDITEVAIQLTSAELTYEAALMATGKVMQTTLLNFI